MKIALIIILAIIGVYILYRICMLIFAAVISKTAFGRRSDKNPLLKYYSAEDFGLTAYPVETKSGKTTIRGFIYSLLPLEECKNLIIIAHGMGPGHCAYTTEIAFFCKNGCAVLAFDDIGCNLSDGKGIKGLECGIVCLECAINYAISDSRLKDKKRILAGHSMGAYAALCATRLKNVDGVVAFSAPDTPSDITCYLASLVMGKFAYKLKHYIKVVSRLKFGKYADMSASQQVTQSNVKALIIHGDSDPAVPVYLSAYAHTQGGNAQKMMCAGKKHNPYNTVNAETELAALSAGLGKSKDMTEEEKNTFFSTRDYKAICEEDEEVMSAVLDFILTV